MKSSSPPSDMALPQDSSFRSSAPGKACVSRSIDDVGARGGVDQLAHIDDLVRNRSTAAVVGAASPESTTSRSGIGRPKCAASAASTSLRRSSHFCLCGAVGSASTAASSSEDTKRPAAYSAFAIPLS